MSKPTPFPLSWPEAWSRTNALKRDRSLFATTIGDSIKGIQRSMRSMGASWWVISSNMATRQDGLPYATGAEPADPGVAVWFTQGGDLKVLACDRWDRARDNLRAIDKALEAMRGMERWGAAQILDKAFGGLSLPPPAQGWRAILGDCKTREEAREAYRRLARDRHPDIGGSHEAMAELVEAMRLAGLELPP